MPATTHKKQVADWIVAVRNKVKILQQNRLNASSFFISETLKANCTNIFKCATNISKDAGFLEADENRKHSIFRPNLRT